MKALWKRLCHLGLGPMFAGMGIGGLTPFAPFLLHISKKIKNVILIW